MTKILNHINTYADLTAYDNDKEKDYPNVSYIQGTDEVKWVKDDPYINVCKYNVTSTSNATNLLNSNNGITYQIIDGIKQDAVQTSYTFDTLGEHIVEYKLDGTSIGDMAFYWCSGLTSVTIGSGVRYIGYWAFQSCSSLTSVTIGSGVTNINNYAFNGCTGLTSVTIPDSVTRIGTGAFYLCSGLTIVTIGSGVTSIDSYAFDSCSKLTSVTIEATTPPSLGSDAFNNTSTNLIIYVPSESLEAFKTATNWKTYASRIKPIS